MKNIFLPETVSQGETPFSMCCNGKPVSDWLPIHRMEGKQLFVSSVECLEMTWDCRRRGIAWEFEARLANTADRSSGLLSGIEFFRMRWPVALESIPVIHHSGGGLTDAAFPSTAWRIKRTELPDWAALKLEGDKGRSSNKDLPIFLVSDDEDLGGLAFVVGYSGNVVSTILRDVDYRSVLVTCSVRGLQLRIPQGESVRLGSVLVLPYEGDSITGKNALRSVLREEICPRPIAPPGLPAVTYVHWFGIENKFTADSLLNEADTVAVCGAEVFEADGGIFKQGTHSHYGAGNWGIENPAKFPDGLESFANDIRAKGMRFGLWCEPESVEAGTMIDLDHSEWLLKLSAPDNKRHLFDFSIPEAADYMTNLIVDMIEKYGSSWSRIDSNLDPDKFWNSIPDPGLRGYKELKHFENYHSFLDSLMTRFPNLHIEGCSSGGRRINLEMLKRSHSFWISDNTVYPTTVHQHIGGANHWLPSHLLNMEAVKYPLFPQKLQPYDQVGDETFNDFWLLTLFGGLFGMGGPHSAYPSAVNEKFKRFIAQYKKVRENLMGDFYPLLPQPSSSADWDAWQFHNPASGRGHVIAFKMRGPIAEMRLPLRDLKKNKSYRLSVFPGTDEFIESGIELMSKGIEVRLSNNYSAILFSYL
jgi:alpha-galactosidase